MNAELQLSLALKDEGMAAVYDAESDHWKEKAWHIATTQIHGLVTGEDVRRTIEDLIGEAHAPQFWGSFTAKLVKAGHLVETGRLVKMRSPKSHGRRTLQYRVVL